MISIVIMMMKLVTTINRLLIWVSLRMCESDERALPTDKSTPDSLEGQSLHRILRHRHRHKDTQTHRHKRRHRQEYSRFLRRSESPTKIETDIFALPGTR